VGLVQQHFAPPGTALLHLAQHGPAALARLTRQLLAEGALGSLLLAIERR
jgi:hypothetical protein